MIIWGWRRSSKDLGECVGATCQTCENRVVLHLLLLKTFFTLFFIPLIPLRFKRTLVCPVCRTSFPVAHRHLEATKDMFDMTAAWRAHSMSDADYDTRVQAYWALTASGPMRGTSELPPLGAGPSDPSKLPPPPPGT